MINRQQRTRFTAAIALLLLLFLASACWRQYVDYGIDQTPLVTSPTVTRGLFSGIEGLDCIPNIAQYEIAQLVRVIDGDSIEVLVDGGQTQVRYIGINTPEYDSPQREEAIKAREENQRLLAGGPLYLFKDISNTDKYDRLLRYIVANGKFINLELVRSGHAESRWYRPDISCQAVFEKAMPAQ